MSPEPYPERIKDSIHPEGFRLRMIQYYHENEKNLSFTARAFRCDRKTVRKWLRRFLKEGPQGLKRKPKKNPPPHKTPHEIEGKVIELKKKNPKLGQDKIKHILSGQYGIEISSSTINRILNQKGLIKKRKKKWQKKRDLKKLREDMNALEELQVDVKELDDIPPIYPLIAKGSLPRYEYSAKDNISTLGFVCLAEEKSLINSVRFIYLLFKHLQSFGIDTSKIKLQSDNGSEFIGSTSAKKRSAFTKLIEDVFGAEHATIPVATPRFNGGVENFHGRIEDEFYSLEDFTSAKDVQERLFGYMLYYNLERPNQGEGINYRTPFEFFREKTGIDDPNICVFPPLILDKIPIYVPQILGRGGDFSPDEPIGPNQFDHFKV